MYNGLDTGTILHDSLTADVGIGLIYKIGNIGVNDSAVIAFAYTFGKANLDSGLASTNKPFPFDTSNLGIYNSRVSQNDIDIYPNPSNGIFRIQCNNKNIFANYTLTDFSGRKIETIQIKSGILELDLSGYQSGIYFLIPANPAVGNAYKLSKY